KLVMTEQTAVAELKRLREVAPAGDPRLTESLRRLATWYSKNRQPQRARPLVQEICEFFKQTHGETAPLTVDAVGWLVSILVSLGKLERAEEMLTELVRRLRSDGTLALDRRAATWNQLVEVCYQRSKPQEALCLCREILVILGDTLQN